MSHSEMLPQKRLPQKCCLEYDLKTLGLLLRRPNIVLVIVHPFRIDPYNIQRRCYLLTNSGIALSKGNKNRTILFFRVGRLVLKYLLIQNKIFSHLHPFTNKVFKNTSLHSWRQKQELNQSRNKKLFKTHKHKENNFENDEQVPKRP